MLNSVLVVFKTFFICTFNASKFSFSHVLSERQTACSFYWKTVWTDVKFLDGSVLENRIRTEFRFSTHPYWFSTHPYWKLIPDDGFEVVDVFVEMLVIKLIEYGQLSTETQIRVLIINIVLKRFTQSAQSVT